MGFLTVELRAGHKPVRDAESTERSVTMLGKIWALVGLTGFLLAGCTEVGSRSAYIDAPAGASGIDGVALRSGRCVVLQRGEEVDGDGCSEYDTPNASANTVYAGGTTRTYVWDTGSRTVVQSLEQFRAINGVPGESVIVKLRRRETVCIRNIESQRIFCFLPGRSGGAGMALFP